MPPFCNVACATSFVLKNLKPEARPKKTVLGVGHQSNCLAELLSRTPGAPELLTLNRASSGFQNYALHGGRLLDEDPSYSYQVLIWMHDETEVHLCTLET